MIRLRFQIIVVKGEKENTIAIYLETDDRDGFVVSDAQTCHLGLEGVESNNCLITVMVMCQ